MNYQRALEHATMAVGTDGDLRVTRAIQTACNEERYNVLCAVINRINKLPQGADLRDAIIEMRDGVIQ